MTFLQQLMGLEVRNIEDPKYPISQEILAGILSGSPSATGKLINPETAMRIVAVYACIRLISGTFASLPAITYRRLSRGKERAPNHPLYPVLHDIANPEMTSVELFETMQAHLLLFGHAYAEVVRNGAGQVKALWPLTPNRVKVERNKRNEIVYVVDLPDGGTARIAQYRMLHIKALLGLSPISQAREALGLSMSAEEFGARFFANDSRPGGVLRTDKTLGDDAAKRLKAGWEAAHSGLHNTHRVAILEEGLQWQQIGIPPQDAQFLETRKFQIAEIARLFSVPPHMIGDLDRSTSWGSGIEQQQIMFLQYTFRDWLRRWEAAINMKLLTESERESYFVEFLVDGLLRADYKTRQEGLSIQRQNGIINADEWRALENMNEIEDGSGKIYLVNGNMIPPDQAGQKSEVQNVEE